MEGGGQREKAENDGVRIRGTKFGGTVLGVECSWRSDRTSLRGKGEDGTGMMGVDALVSRVGVEGDRVAPSPWMPAHGLRVEHVPGEAAHPHALRLGPLCGC